MEPEKFGKYQVAAKIGEGGFGEVYRGRDPTLKRKVAIKTCKTVDPRLLERFVREAEIAARLQHPNIVTVFDFGYRDQTPYLVQEYLAGEDLDRKIRRRQPIEAQAKVDVLRQVALGLRHAHLQGVVHRDVKPANVRVLDDGLVKIMDFGIAKLLTSEVELTQTGITLGSARYLPPEQFHGEKVDLRADIFSFGVTAYELLTYECPFDGDTVARIFYRITHEDPRPIEELWPECPPRLARCVTTCLQKDPTHRYSDLAPVIAELEAHLGGSAGAPVASGGSPAGEPASPPSRAVPPPPPPVPTTPLEVSPDAGEESGSFFGRSYAIVFRRPWAARAAILALVALGAFAMTYLVGRFWQTGAPPPAEVAERGSDPPASVAGTPVETGDRPTAAGSATGEPPGELEPADAAPPESPPAPAAEPPAEIEAPAEDPPARAVPEPVTVEATEFEQVADDPAAGPAPGDELEIGVSAEPEGVPAPPQAPDGEAILDEAPPETAGLVPETALPPPGEESVAAPPPPPRRDPPEPVRRGVTVFQNRDFQGTSETFYADDPNLRDNVIGNDTATSVRVDPGCRAMLYEHGDYQGKVTVLTGDRARLRGSEVGNDELSSLRISCGGSAAAPPPPAGPRGARLYSEEGFGGVSELLQGNDPNLVNNAVGDDAVSSVRVSPGCHVLLYSRENYQGKETLLTGDASDLRGTQVGDDQASSVQVVCLRR